MELSELKTLKGKRKLTMLTAYDYPMARVLSTARIDIILVGDSLGMAVLGYKDTKSVTLEDMIRHTAAVVRGNAGNSLIVADMPIATTNNAAQAIVNCRLVLDKTGADAVKIEGEPAVVEAVVSSGIAVMGHTGLKPQTAEKYGVVGKQLVDAENVFQEALALEKAGAFALVLECVPIDLADRITAAVKIPTIGIGAGVGCDGQVLVCNDMLGFNDNFKPKFLRQYLNLNDAIMKAAIAYRDDVLTGDFPNDLESYH